jgi:hypothetical protein
VAVVNRRLMRRSAGIDRALNHQSEREVSLIDEGSARDVRHHFGSIFAAIAYVWAYLGGFDQVPAVLQRASNLADIRRRLDGLEDAEAPVAPSPAS